MVDSVHNISRSSIDESRFGVRVARASGVSSANLMEVLNYCSDNDVKLLIARASASDIRDAQAMERAGFLLMDTLVYYARNLTKNPLPEDSSKVPIRCIDPQDEDSVRAVAAEAFKGYFGHYHADSRLDRDKCDAGYMDWAVRSCVDRKTADEVLVAEMDGSVVGFATLRLNGKSEGEGVLFGVHPSAQGHGIYKSFMVRAMQWFKERGAEQMVVSTQINNLAVQKVWVRVGFEPSHAYYTFHRWFDNPEGALR